MPENFLISKMFQDIIIATNTTLLDEEVGRKFARMIGDFFGIEKVVISTANRNEVTQNNLYGYVTNTKKTYVDNQLSEYSSFPELINYKNRGFKSCAIVPIVVSGKVVSIVEMLSSLENKFSDELITSASFGAYLTGLTMLYKSESDRNVKLASYFDSAFNSGDSQLLVSQDGKVIKANRSARNDIFTAKNSSSKIEEIIGLDFNQLFALSKKGPTTIPLETGGTTRFYRISASPASETLLHVSLQDTTELKRIGLVLESMDSESYVSALYLDNRHIVKGATEGIKRAIGYDKNLILDKDIVELVVERKRGEIKELFEKQNMKERIHGTIDLATASGLPAHFRFVLMKWINGYIMLLSDATSEGYNESIKGAFTDFINSTSDAVITMDALGYIKDCNMSAESVLGYSRNELMGKEMKSMYLDQSIFERDITYVRNGAKVDNSYVVLLGRHEGNVDATHSIRLFRNADSLDYVIVIKELETKRSLADLRGQLEREQKRISRLRATGDLKSQFIYNISHELKTPLTNIKGFSKLHLQRRIRRAEQGPAELPWHHNRGGRQAHADNTAGA